QGDDETAKAETRAITAWVLQETLKLLHPIMPYITEELWERRGAAGMLMLAPWPELDRIKIDADADAEMTWVTSVVSQIRALRSTMNVPNSARLALPYRDASPAAVERLQRHDGVVRTMARLASIEAASGPTPKGSAQLAAPEVTLILPLEGVIDSAA